MNAKLIFVAFAAVICQANGQFLQQFWGNRPQTGFMGLPNFLNLFRPQQQQQMVIPTPFGQFMWQNPFQGHIQQNPLLPARPPHPYPSILPFNPSYSSEEVYPVNSEAFQSEEYPQNFEDPIVQIPSEYPVSSGEYVSGEYTTGEFTSGENTPGEYTTGEITSGEIISGEYTSGEYTSGGYTSGEYPSGYYPSGEGVASEETAIPDSSEHVPSEFLPGQYPSAEIAPGEYQDLEEPTVQILPYPGPIQVEENYPDIVDGIQDEDSLQVEDDTLIDPEEEDISASVIADSNVQSEAQSGSQAEAQAEVQAEEVPVEIQSETDVEVEPVQAIVSDGLLNIPA